MVEKIQRQIYKTYSKKKSSANARLVQTEEVYFTNQVVIF